MTMQLSILIDADGNAAIAEVNTLGKAVKSTGAATEVMGGKSAKAAKQTRSLGTSAKATDAQVDLLSAAQTRNAATAKQMGAANRQAAGNMGNLVAQFNDIGVMMAAGQNPLTMALQQGTQISQVIGPMGAAGAVKSLGGAFIGMLNPISLVTIGTIAGGAALFQWARGALSAGDAGGEYADVLDRVEGQLSEYFSLIESHDDFGAAGFAIAREDIERTSQAYEDLIAIAKIEAFNSIGDLNENLTAGLTHAGLFKDEMTEIDNLLSGKKNSSLWLVNIEQTDNFLEALNQLSNAVTLDAQYSAAVQLREMFKSTVDVAGDMTDSQIEFWRNLSQSVFQMELLGAAAVANEATLNGTNDALMRQYQLYGQSRIESEAQRVSAQALLGDMMAQNNLQATINVHGRDSAQVAALRAQAERDVLEETLAGLDVSEAMKNQLRLALEINIDLSNTDLGAGIRAAASDAADLAATLAAISTPAMQDEDAAMAGSLAPDRQQRELNRRALANFQRLTTPKASRSGAGATDRQSEAVAGLISGLEDELAVMRELDPIQKEMLRNRETLATASSAERSQIEELIGTRNAETAALEQQTVLWNEVGSIGTSFFKDMTSGAGGLETALGNVADRIADMAIQALLLGEGPLADLLGIGGGGLLGMMFPSLMPANSNAAPTGAALPAKADGGKIYGPGSGTSDDVLMWGSNGEFMMTAKATAAYQPMLEMMNAGALPSFAGGGAIGGGMSSGGFGAPSYNISIDNRGSTPVSGEIHEESDGAGGRKATLILADQVGSALTQPGGAAKRALQGSYGLRQRGAKR